MMSAVLIVLGVVFGLALLLFFYGVAIYNGLVSLKNRFQNAFSQIDVQLKRRHDLIPNLVETAKGYMAHEKNTLDAVISARNQANSALQNVQQNGVEGEAGMAMIKAESVLSGALGRLMAVVENYPDLKANQNMMAIQEELTTTENKIAFARQAYNDSVMTYNTKREQFPDNILAGMFNFKEAILFEIQDEKEKEVPQVKF